MYVYHRSDFDCTKEILVRRQHSHGEDKRIGKKGYDKGEKQKSAKPVSKKSETQFFHGSNFVRLAHGATYLDEHNYGNPYIFSLFTEQAHHDDVKGFGKNIFLVDLVVLAKIIGEYFYQKNVNKSEIHINADFVTYGRPVRSTSVKFASWERFVIPERSDKKCNVFSKDLDKAHECEYRIAIWVPEDEIDGDQLIQSEWLEYAFRKGVSL